MDGSEELRIRKELVKHAREILIDTLRLPTEELLAAIQDHSKQMECLITGNDTTGFWESNPFDTLTLNESWVNYLSVDCEGDLWGYSQLPVYNNGYWNVITGMSKDFGNIVDEIGRDPIETLTCKNDWKPTNNQGKSK